MRIYGPHTRDMTKTTGLTVKAGTAVRFNGKTQTVTNIEGSKSSAGYFFEVTMQDAAGNTDRVSLMADTRLELA